MTRRAPVVCLGIAHYPENDAPRITFGQYGGITFAPRSVVGPGDVATRDASITLSRTELADLIDAMPRSEMLGNTDLSWAFREVARHLRDTDRLAHKPGRSIDEIKG